MKKGAPRIGEKLVSKLLVSFTAADFERLIAAGRDDEVEAVEFVRRAALAAARKHEEEMALLEVARLRSAKIDLCALVDYALARQAQERAQVSLPGIFSGGGQ